MHALPGHDGGLLSTTSVPLPNVYSGTTRSVNSSDSSDGSWAAAGPEAASGSATNASQDQQQQRAAGGQTVAAAQPAAAAVDRYGSCNGASDISAADAQECAYPSWCSSSSWSPLISDRHKQQQQLQHQQAESGQRQQAEVPAEQAAAAAAAANSTVLAQQDTAGGSAGEGCDEEQAGPMPPSLPEVDFLEKIGRGSFGDVFKGMCDD